ncbi:MAG: hypothetical protein HY914_21005 [Desulfomonile tiedjei]|nr:hypothetical protein [Desulfomonile tiedjei]
MQRLREALVKTIPAECFVNGSSISESGRSFSIKLARDEQVLAAKLDHPAMNWPESQKVCDAVFLCCLPDRDELLVALVELKGTDVRDARKQIEATSRALCNRQKALKQAHTQPVKAAVQLLGKMGHGKGVLGVIVSAVGLPLDYKERAKIWKNYKIIFWTKSGQAREMSCRELAGKFRG